MTHISVISDWLLLHCDKMVKQCPIKMNTCHKCVFVLASSQTGCCAMRHNYDILCQDPIFGSVKSSGNDDLCPFVRFPEQSKLV